MITYSVASRHPCHAGGGVVLCKEDMLSGTVMLVIYVVVFIAIFYFMAIRPQQRQRRAHQELLSSLKKGDRISTAAGIYGTVKRIEDNIVHVEIARGVTMKISRRAVVEILNRDTAEGRAALPEGSTRRRKSAVVEEEYEDTTPEEFDTGAEQSSDEFDAGVESGEDTEDDSVER